MGVGRNTGKQLTFLTKVIDRELFKNKEKNPAKVLTRQWLSENTNLGLTFNVAHIA